jgi:hypothetical protein
VKLPRGAEAIIPVGKIELYCLNPEHNVGGPKARVFSAALGLTVRDAPLLKAALLSAARTGAAELVLSDPRGDRYRIDFVMRHGGAERIVRSGWTIREPGGRPYLSTAFVLPSSHG